MMLPQPGSGGTGNVGGIKRSATHNRDLLVQKADQGLQA